MSSVCGMILQWGSAIKVSNELPVVTRHRRDMTEKLLKATLNPNKQQQLFIPEIWAASWQNQQNGLCAQRRLRSALASALSDQSLRCPYEETLGPQLPTERTAKTLIRLSGCPGWSEPYAGRSVILLVLSWAGSYSESYYDDIEYTGADSLTAAVSVV